MSANWSMRKLTRSDREVTRAFGPALACCLLMMFLSPTLVLARHVFPSIGEATGAEAMSFVMSMLALFASAFLFNLVWLQNKIIELQRRVVELEKRADTHP